MGDVFVCPVFAVSHSLTTLIVDSTQLSRDATLRTDPLQPDNMNVITSATGFTYGDLTSL